MNGGAFRSAFGKRPALESVGAGVDHILSVGTGQSGGKRHIHGQIDGGIDTGRRSHWGRAMGPAERVGGQIGMRPGHAKGWSHAFPAMTGLAGKIGNLVHGQNVGLDRVSYPLRSKQFRWGKEMMMVMML